jgi:hypothetical protein
MDFGAVTEVKNILCQSSHDGLWFRISIILLIFKEILDTIDKIFLYS